MREEFGLDKLPEHALEEVHGNAWVVNPARREIGKTLRKQRNAVGHLRRRRAAEDDAGKARELDARIQACDEAVAGLVRVGGLTEEQRLQALPAPLRQLLEFLRMAASRAETAMANAVAPELDNPDTARGLLHRPARAQDLAIAPRSTNSTAPAPSSRAPPCA